jgi:hypothetical protein
LSKLTHREYQDGTLTFSKTLIGDTVRIRGVVFCVEKKSCADRMLVILPTEGTHWQRRFFGVSEREYDNECPTLVRGKGKA